MTNRNRTPSQRTRPNARPATTAQRTTARKDFGWHARDIRLVLLPYLLLLGLVLVIVCWGYYRLGGFEQNFAIHYPRILATLLPLAVGLYLAIVLLFDRRVRSGLYVAVASGFLAILGCWLVPTTDGMNLLTARLRSLWLVHELYHLPSDEREQFLRNAAIRQSIREQYACLAGDLQVAEGAWIDRLCSAVTAEQASAADAAAGRAVLREKLFPWFAPNDYGPIGQTVTKKLRPLAVEYFRLYAQGQVDQIGADWESERDVLLPRYQKAMQDSAVELAAWNYPVKISEVQQPLVSGYALSRRRAYERELQDCRQQVESDPAGTVSTLRWLLRTAAEDQTLTWDSGELTTVSRELRSELARARDWQLGMIFLGDLSEPLRLADLSLLLQEVNEDQDLTRGASELAGSRQRVCNALAVTWEATFLPQLQESDAKLRADHAEAVREMRRLQASVEEDPLARVIPARAARLVEQAGKQFTQARTARGATEYEAIVKPSEAAPDRRVDALKNLLAQLREAGSMARADEGLTKLVTRVEMGLLDARRVAFDVQLEEARRTARPLLTANRFQKAAVLARELSDELTAEAKEIGRTDALTEFRDAFEYVAKLARVAGQQEPN